MSHQQAFVKIDVENEPQSLVEVEDFRRMRS